MKLVKRKIQTIMSFKDVDSSEQRCNVVLLYDRLIGKCNFLHRMEVIMSCVGFSFGNQSKYDQHLCLMKQDE